LQKQTEENDYIIARGDAKLVKELKYWRQLEYYQLLEQIIAESERNKSKK